jgi:hypothetical protein
MPITRSQDPGELTSLLTGLAPATTMLSRVAAITTSVHPSGNSQEMIVMSNRYVDALPITPFHSHIGLHVH